MEYDLETTSPLLFPGLKESRSSRTLPRANTSKSTPTIARRFHTSSSLPSLSSESRRGVRIIRWTYIAHEDWRGTWLSVLMRLHYQSSQVPALSMDRVVMDLRRWRASWLLGITSCFFRQDIERDRILPTPTISEIFQVHLLLFFPHCLGHFPWGFF